MAAKIDVDGREFSSELEREYGFNKADTRCRVENWLPVLQLPWKIYASNNNFHHTTGPACQANISAGWNSWLRRTMEDGEENYLYKNVLEY